MIRTEILKWLNSDRNFDKGLKLAALAGTSRKELSKISLDQFGGKKSLFFLLKDLSGIKADKPPDTKPKENKEQPDPEDKKRLSEFAGNAIVLASKKEADLLYKEMMNKRAVLFSLCTTKEALFENEIRALQQRATLTKEVVHLDYKVGEAYAAYRFSLQHGYLPETKPKLIKETPDLLLYKRIRNVRCSISRLRKKQSNLTAKQLDLLAFREQELTSLITEYHHELNRL